MKVPSRVTLSFQNNSCNLARRFGATRDLVSTAAASTDSFHIRLDRVEPVTGDRRHPGGGRPERLAVGRNLGIFRPAPRLGAGSIAHCHMAPFFMLAATVSFFAAMRVF